MADLHLQAALLLISLAAAAGQVPTADPALAPAVARQIHVDERCRVLSQERMSPADAPTKPAFRNDVGVCRLENQLHTSHIQETVEEGVLTRTRLESYEATFVLTNPTATPVVFVVDQTLPKGWKLDTTAVPDKTSENLATFHINARPGQTVQLRVGVHN